MWAIIASHPNSSKENITIYVISSKIDVEKGQFEML